MLGNKLEIVKMGTFRANFTKVFLTHIKVKFQERFRSGSLGNIESSSKVFKHSNHLRNARKHLFFFTLHRCSVFDALI